MKEEIPENWRELEPKDDPELIAMEKETTINCPNDTDTCYIYSDVSTIIKWVQSIEESNPVAVRTNGSGQILGVEATIPKGIIKLQGNSRKSNAHSQMVSYGDMK
jgi:hypothetical protein